jgi:putative transposase
MIEEGQSMKYDPEIHHRRSIRLRGYDYTRAGGYYITIVTFQRQHLFGEVIDGEMVLNALGQIAKNEWFRTAELRPYIALFEDEFITMPNHIHGIIWIVKEHGGTTAVSQTENFRKPVSGSIPTVIRAYKSAIT